MNNLDWTMFFDGWSPVLRTCILGTLSYIALVFLLRASGKRTLSKMNAFDFVVTIAFGSTLATILISKQVSLAQGCTAFALLILLQYVNTFVAVRLNWFQKLIKAEPTLLFFQGEYLVKAMKRQRITREEILAAIRQHGFALPQDVSAVILETEGSLSVLQHDEVSLASLTDVGVQREEELQNTEAVNDPQKDKRNTSQSEKQNEVAKSGMR